MEGGKVSRPAIEGHLWDTFRAMANRIDSSCLRSDRRRFLKAVGSGAVSLVTTANAWPQMEPKKSLPNIVYVLADDLGYGDTSCYNSESKISTPNIDRLATQGMRFTDAHSPSAICVPTRYGILTGRYCWRTWLKRGGGSSYDSPLIERDRLTVASLLKKNSYATACIGKWHLGLGWVAKGNSSANVEKLVPSPACSGGPASDCNVDFAKDLTDSPLDHGFGYTFFIPGAASESPWVFIRNRHLLNSHLVYKSAAELNNVRSGLVAIDWKQEDIDPTFIGEAVSFIERHHKEKPGQPFFLYLPISSPHDPPIPPSFIKGKSGLCERADMVMLADWDLGQIMATLDRLNLSKNTLLIFTSDNGPLPICGDQHAVVVGDANKGHSSAGKWRGFKSQVWEGGTRIPFIARWPGKIKPGTISSEPIELNDLMATCAAITGTRLPPNAGEDSYNILPALLGEKLKKPIREAVVSQSSSGVFGIREGDWKLIVGTTGSGGWVPPSGGPPKPGAPGQLYNLAEDPAEGKNLWDKHPEVVKRLSALLERYKQDGRSAPR